MSVPSPYTQRGSSEPKEDCRDYLRTGRCKYGASCKYNHPPNVQSGGGMRTPIDPSEPMFPIRPNEPECQYYMKHGTCKFGQACKFHHPPQSALNAATVNSNGVTSIGRQNDSSQVSWNPSSGDSNAASFMVQFLPQRPGEPDCIYFTKNRRCKFGATCRFHHPLNFQDRRNADDGRRQQMSVPVQQLPEGISPKIQYVTRLPSNAYHHGQILVADGSLAFVAIDGSSGAQVIQMSQNGGDVNVAYAPSNSTSMSRSLGMNQEHTSSSSSASIASSFDTANSGIDQLGTHTDSSSLLWNRPKRSGSGNSLNAYTVDSNGHGRTHIIQQQQQQQQQQHHYHHNARSSMGQNPGDSNTAHRLHRVQSSSSQGDTNSAYYDASTSMNRQGHITQSSVAGPNGPWRSKRSSSFDHTRPTPSSNYNQGEAIPKSTSVPDALNDESRAGGGYQRESSQRSPVVRGRPPVSGTRNQRRVHQSVEEDDDGLSMMTSALLTMLDTTEEAAHEHYDENYDAMIYGQPRQSHDRQSNNKYPSPSPIPHHDANISNYINNDHNGISRSYPGVSYMPSSFHNQPVTPEHDHGYVVSMQHNTGNVAYRDVRMLGGAQDMHGGGSSWSPTWQGSNTINHSLQENAESISMMQARPTSNTSHGSSHVGLYLP